MLECVRSLVGDVTMESRVQSQVMTFMMDKVTLGACFSPSNSVSPVSIVPPMLYTRLHLNNSHIRRTSGRMSKQSSALYDSVERWTESTLTCSGLKS
jgi:hypothetical protein